MDKKEIIEKLIENNYDTHIKKNIAELTGNAFQDDEYIGEYDVYKEQIYFEMQDEHHKFCSIDKNRRIQKQEIIRYSRKNYAGYKKSS